jgi:hypothetical protein
MSKSKAPAKAKGGKASPKAKGKAAKGKGKGGKGGKAKRAKRGLVQNQYVAFAGLLGLGLIAVLMLRGQIDLIEAGRRAAVLLGVVLVVERLVLPICRVLVGSPAEKPAAVPAAALEEQPAEA